MWRGIAIGSCLGGLLVAALSGQSQRSPATLDDLLAELRGLRGDLNESHTVSMRTELLVGRVQVQEQRIATIRRAHADVQFQLRGAIQQRERTESTVTGLEDAVRSDNLAQQRQLDLARELAHIKDVLVREQRVESELRYRDAELANMLALEEGRANDFNARLDELERALLR
jgi:hypothetical protein